MSKNVKKGGGYFNRGGGGVEMGGGVQKVSKNWITSRGGPPVLTQRKKLLCIYIE